MGKKILLIDDDEGIVEAMTIFLEEEGFDVESYSDGLSIEEKIKKVKPDLILIDNLLPGKNGTEIIKSLKNNTDTKTIPVIMVAANRIYKKEARELNIAEFLEKPFDIYELLNVIKRHIKSTK